MTGTIFVGRDAQLAQLQRALKRVLAGQAQTVFIAGEAGAGKTALLREYARRAQGVDRSLVVAIGNCNAQTGLGDPYLPFREVLRLLTGDVEAEMADNAVNAENAGRLRDLLVHTSQVLVDVSPDLAGLLLAGIPGAALAARIAALVAKRSGLTEKLGKLSQRPEPTTVDPNLDQNRVFEQYTSALRVLSAQCPIVIILDDLQWADSASIQLLFHLSRQLASSRVLILGAYRPDEVALGRAGQPHPLDKVLAELKRYYGDIVVDLAQSDEHERRHFVDALLDAEPNLLGAGFRDALFHHTEGHPLFAIELMRDMQERGDLLRDADGRWIEAPTLAWDALPARVEGVVQERIQRLDASLRDVLVIASVEGQEFTLQVIAQLQNTPERTLLRVLSQELDKRHHLVEELAELKLGKQVLVRFQFAHALFQKYLYGTLGASERRLLHEDMARLLETLYQGHTDEITVQLARHYSEAGDVEKAVTYLVRAGDQARTLYADQEAIEFYERALELLKEQRNYAQAARILMKLGLTHQIAFDFQRSREAYEEGFELWQHADESVEELPPAPHALRTFWAEPATLSPGLAGDSDATGLADQLFRGLVERGPDMDILPDLAQSWEILDDGRRYVFHLRGEDSWTDGTPVTAGDFEYAWVLALQPGSKAPAASLLYDVKGAKAFHCGETSDPAALGVRALDATTLQVELESPCSYFLHLLAHPVSFALPRHHVQAHGAVWANAECIISCGPFKLSAYEAGSGMVLERNPQYHGRVTGNVDSVELSFARDPSARLDAFETGRFDIVTRWASTAADVNRIRQRHASECLSLPLLSTCFVQFDTTRPPFDDARVRRAMALAVDREKLAGVACRGLSSPALGGFVPPGMPGHSPRIGLPYDPAAARQLLADAGHANASGLGTLQATTVRAMLAEAEYLAQEWKRILGVEVAWQAISAADGVGRADQPPNLLVDGWLADYPDPDNFLRVARQYFSSNWTNESYDALVERARRLPDQTQRMRLYQQAETILIQECPLLPLTHEQVHLLVKPWVRRFPTSPVRSWFWKDVVIEPH